LIIEGIAKEMQASGIGEQNCNELTEKLKNSNRQMYQNLWMKHAKEDADANGEPLDIEKELKTARYTFDCIYKHGDHPE
jgi:alpha-ketoglutarate-dependent taurine dioxygenase